MSDNAVSLKDSEGRRPNMRFLIVNPFGIGDVIFTTPMIESIKAYLPESYIGFICNMRTAPLMAANPHVDKVFVYEKDEYRRLWKESKSRCIKSIFGLFKEVREARFDLCFDLSLAQEYGLFLWLAGIRQRVGYNFKERGIFLTRRLELKEGYSERHMADYYLRLAESAGIRPLPGAGLKIYIPDEDKKAAREILYHSGVSDDDRFVCIIPAAGASWGAQAFFKRWRVDNFVELAKRLEDESGVKIVLLGSDKEDSICDFMAEKHPGCIDLCAKTSLLESAAIMEKSSLVITNDGGPLHLGCATGTKTLSIFGPVDDKVYGPYPQGQDHRVVKRKDLDCRPCYKNFKMPDCADRHCLNGIDTQIVLIMAKDMLSRHDDKGESMI